MASLKQDIISLQTEILDLENKFHNYASEIEIREKRWKTCQKKIDDLSKVNDGSCTLNIGGTKFDVSLYTLKCRRGTIFYKQILRGEIKKGGTAFYDRDDCHFPVILNFLRTGKFNADGLREEERDDILAEATFYEINFIIEKLKATAQEVDFTAYEVNEVFKYEGEDVGTKSAKDLKDESLRKGICANTPGNIMITLSREIEFDQISIGGYNGNSTAWYSSYGVNATISSSSDKVSWKQVGVIPDGFGASILNVRLTKSKGKYIRFAHTDYLGIGFLEVKEAKK